jgi:hypothetical protein
LGFLPSYPDTIFVLKLDTADPRTNLYTYTGVYFIDPTLKPFSIIYFKFAFTAGKPTFTPGQNYPKGVITGDKTFKVNVR